MAFPALSAACVPGTFAPTLFGADILSVNASLVTNYSTASLAAYRYTQPSENISNATFCNVTVAYTHPGENDTVNVEAWLPVSDWNGRFQAVGGGGWVAGRFFLSYNAMAGAMNDGYATITTDAGLGSATDPSTWALLSPGNVNMYNLENLASVSLGDEAVIGKSLIKSFYGSGPTYSYWNGCSQGGRQGMMLAQQYPTLYDGIIAGAPAIYWSQLFSHMYWPQQFMNMAGNYPHGCELDAITDAAISLCDGLDGAADGIISDVETCMVMFDPFSVVGETFNCTQTGEMMEISEEAAQVANATWAGQTSATGRKLWHGINMGADLTGNSATSYGQPGIAATNCTGQSCSGEPYDLVTAWLKLFIAKDPTFDYQNISHEQYDQMFYTSQQQYGMLQTSDPDLSAFKRAGGKLISFHGLADNIIPTKDTEQYYHEVSALVPDVDDFYRYFPVPGLGHCFGGKGGQPTALFSQLRDWVENGTAPDTSPISFTGSDTTVQNRILCPYPRVARFDADCGDTAKSECWSCISQATGQADSEDDL